MPCSDTKTFPAVTTIEATYIMILFVSIFVMLLHLFFFYYDRAMLSCAAHESAVYGSQQLRIEGSRPDDIKTKTEEVFYRKIDDKLIWLSAPKADIAISGGILTGTVTVHAVATHPPVSTHVQCTAFSPYPEDRLRLEQLVPRQSSAPDSEK